MIEASDISIEMAADIREVSPSLISIGTWSPPGAKNVQVSSANAKSSNREGFSSEKTPPPKPSRLGKGQPPPIPARKSQSTDINLRPVEIMKKGKSPPVVPPKPSSSHVKARLEQKRKVRVKQSPARFGLIQGPTSCMD